MTEDCSGLDMFGGCQPFAPRDNLCEADQVKRNDLPVEHPYAGVTWSSTTLVG